MSGEYKGYTPARRKANKKYDEKTYKQYSLLLRYEEDADIIKSLDAAIESGMTKREWLRGLYYGDK